MAGPAPDRVRTGHGRIDLRGIALLPADAPGEHMRTTWPPVCTIARIERQRGHVRAGHSVKTETETTYLITSPGQSDPDDILRLDRRHWRIEAMHRDRDVTPGEDGYTNRPGHAPAISSPTTAPRAHCPNASRTRLQELSKQCGKIAGRLSGSYRINRKSPFSESPCECLVTLNMV